MAWHIEHRDITPHIQLSEYYDPSYEWLRWKRSMTLNTALKRLAELMTGNRYYEYRAVNPATGEIIPGEIMCR